MSEANQAHDSAEPDLGKDQSQPPAPDLGDVGVVDDQYKDLDPEIAAFYREKDKFISDPDAYERAAEAKENAFEREYGDSSQGEEEAASTPPAPQKSDDEPSPPPPRSEDGTGNFRFKPDNDVEALAYKLKRENPILSMREALERADRDLNGSPPANDDDSSAPAETIEDIENQIEEARAEEKKAATEDFDREAEFAARDKIRQLKSRKAELKERDESLQDAQAEKAEASYQEYLGQYRESERIVAREFPVASNPDSEFYKRTEELDAWARDNHPELYGSPDKPMRLAEMVAKEQSIKKRSEVPPSSPSASSGSEPARPATPSPASGSARTQGGSPIQDDIDRLTSDPTSTEEDYFRLKEKVLTGG